MILLHHAPRKSPSSTDRRPTRIHWNIHQLETLFVDQTQVVNSLMSRVAVWALAMKLPQTSLMRSQRTLVQVMALCRQALGQWWPRSISPHGTTRLQWNKVQRMDSQFTSYGIVMPSDNDLQCFNVRITFTMNKYGKYGLIMRFEHPEATFYKMICRYPDSKVHGANVGPTWGRQDPGGPHVGPMNFANWVFVGFIYYRWWSSLWLVWWGWSTHIRSTTPASFAKCFICHHSGGFSTPVYFSDWFEAWDEMKQSLVIDH